MQMQLGPKHDLICVLVRRLPRDDGLPRDNLVSRHIGIA